MCTSYSFFSSQLERQSAKTLLPDKLIVLRKCQALRNKEVEQIGIFVKSEALFWMQRTSKYVVFGYGSWCGLFNLLVFNFVLIPYVPILAWEFGFHLEPQQIILVFLFYSQLCMMCSLVSYFYKIVTKIGVMEWFIGVITARSW